MEHKACIVSSPVDILYVVGGGAKAINDRPLRWSLRSLEKHAKNVGRVIVVGEPPAWLSDKAESLPIDQTTFGEGKGWRMFFTEVAAVRAANLTRPFLYSSDDHYLCRDADFAAWPRYCRNGELDTMERWSLKNRPPDLYRLSLIKTRIALARAGLPHTRRYPLHLNTWIDPAYVDEAEAFGRRAMGMSRFGLEHTSIWEALWERDNPDAEWTVYAHDRKVKSAADCKRKVAAGLPGFSTSPDAETRADVVAWMDNYFSTPSRWEKEDV